MAALLSCFVFVLFVLYHAEPQVVQWKTLYPAKKISGANSQLSMLDMNSNDLEQTLNDTIRAAWTLFKIKYKRMFLRGDDEYERFEIFAGNFMKILLHNTRYLNGKVHYKMSVNEFADKTDEELRGMNCLSLARMPNAHRLVYTMDSIVPPDVIDWRQKGSVTPVKNQGRCGSCWAFSATGAIEGQYFQKKNKLLRFSEQQLVDCSSDFGNNACDGGVMDAAFEYVKSAKGLNTEEDYPYVSGDTSEPNPRCHFNLDRAKVVVTDYVDLPRFSEESLMHALASKGPISVAINAMDSFAFYHSGIYSDINCSGDLDSLNHGVLLVGYGIENGTSYWLIKNSWGASWGDGGYVKMQRGANNMCGIASLASYPIVHSIP